MHRDRLADRFLGTRHFVQLLFAVLLNGYVAGFAQGKIYTGDLKAACVPVLNCYSCPGALGSCPIGALQSVLGANTPRFPFYVLGTVMLTGVLLGRFVCGFLCPFGFIQDLLNKIPHPSVTVPAKLDAALRWLKYVVLVFLVVALPLLARPELGASYPWFCKLLCPAGTLQAGLPLVALDSQLRSLIGPLFSWKVALLVAIVVGVVFVPRFFCRYLCPLGAFYSLFNRFSLYQMRLDESKCVQCGSCKQVCPMAVDMPSQVNGLECIRCGKCQRSCAAHALSLTTVLSKEERYAQEE